VLSNTATEWQNKSGDETGVFGVDGGELAAKVRSKSTNIYVRNLFQLQSKIETKELGTGVSVVKSAMNVESFVERLTKLPFLFEICGRCQRMHCSYRCPYLSP
jgi:hypothetical protein